MDLLAQLAAAIGFTPAEGEELTVDAVLAAVLEYLDAEPEAIAAAVGDEQHSLSAAVLYRWSTLALSPAASGSPAGRISAT